MSTTTTPTFAEIENARRRWAAAGHTVKRAFIDIHEVNPDDPFGEPCWRIDDAAVMLSARDLISQAPAQAARPNPGLLTLPRRDPPTADTGLASLVAVSETSLAATTAAENAAIQRLPIARPRRDGGTQPRAALDEETISDYAEAMRAGARFPSVIVFHDGTDYWLADGFHRVNAAMRAGLAEIEVEVIAGTQRDAVLYSVGANASHGLRRSNADKRRAVERLLRDDLWSQWSDREIARRCNVNHETVSSVRKVLTGGIASDERTYTTRHGTITTMNTAAIGQSAASEQIGRAPAMSPVAPANPDPDLHDATPAEISALLDHINETAAIAYTDRAWMRDYVESAGKTRGLRITPSQAAEAIQQFIDTEAETQRQQRAAEIVQAAVKPTAPASVAPAPAASVSVAPAPAASVSVAPALDPLPVWRLERLIEAWAAQTWTDEAKREPVLFELKARHDRSKEWGSLTAAINGQYNKGDLIQAINNVYNQINLRRIRAAQEHSLAVLGERQKLVNQVEMESLKPAAAVLGGALAAFHPGAWRLVYTRIFGLDAAEEASVGDIINEIAVRWLRGHLNYNELHDPAVVRGSIGALFARYDLRAPWLDDGERSDVLEERS